MGFGTDAPTSHEDEAALQAEIDAQSAEAVEAPVENAPEDTVSVRRTNPELSSVAVAGYPLDFGDSDTVKGVPAEIAVLLEDSENVEVVK